MASKMWRRLFAIALATGIGLAAVVSCSQSAPPSPVTSAGAPAPAAAKQIKWRMAGHMPLKHFSSVISVDLADRVQKATDGNFVITYSPQETLMPASEEASATMRGTIEIALDAPQYTELVIPASGILTLPFTGLGTAQWKEAIALGKPLRQAVADVYSKSGLVLLGMWTHGPIGIAARKPMATLADWKGSKARVSGSTLVAVAKAAGAEVVSMTGDEAVDAMRRGMLDASNVPASSTFSRGYGEFIKSWVDWGLSETITIWYVSQQALNALPPAYQKELTAAAADLEKKGWALFEDDNKTALEGLKKQSVGIVTPAPDEIRKMVVLADPLNEQWATKIGATGKQLLDLVKQARGY